MSKIKIVPFKKEHFDIYRERELERDMLGDLIEFFQSRTPEHGPSYTALLDNNVVAIAGVQIMFPGVGEGWVFGTELIYAHKFFFAKSVKCVECIVAIFFQCTLQNFTAPCYHLLHI